MTGEMAVSDSSGYPSFKLMRKHVRRGLEKFRHGEFFMNFGLDESLELVPPSGSALPKPKQKDHQFNKFMKAVATLIAEETEQHDSRQLKKAMIKEFIEKLQVHREKWADLIRGPDVKSDDEGKDPSAAVDTAPHDGSVGEKAKASGAKRGRLKKKKRGPGRPPKSKNKAKKGGKLKSLEDEHHDEEPVVETREEFERKKAAVLESIPDNVKRLFQQVGFAKWQKQWLPALVLSPYSVPPGGVRDEWFKMYEKVKENYRLGNMSLLVFWYGAEDSSYAYSLVPTKNFLNYEDGCAQNLHEVPKKIKKKIEQGKKLTGPEELTRLGIQQINDAAKEAPQDRKHLLTDFLELVQDEKGDLDRNSDDEKSELLDDDQDEEEELLDDDDDDDDDNNDDDDDDDDDNDDAHSDDEILDDYESSDNDEDFDFEQEKISKKGKSKKRKLKEVQEAKISTKKKKKKKADQETYKGDNDVKKKKEKGKIDSKPKKKKKTVIDRKRKRRKSNSDDADETNESHSNIQDDREEEVKTSEIKKANKKKHKMAAEDENDVVADDVSDKKKSKKKNKKKAKEDHSETTERKSKNAKEQKSEMEQENSEMSDSARKSAKKKKKKKKVKEEMEESRENGTGNNKNTLEEDDDDDEFESKADKVKSRKKKKKKTLKELDDGDFDEYESKSTKEKTKDPSELNESKKKRKKMKIDDENNECITTQEDIEENKDIEESESNLNVEPAGNEAKEEADGKDINDKLEVKECDDNKLKQESVEGDAEESKFNEVTSKKEVDKENLSDAERREREQKVFEECEERFLPLLDQWKEAVKKKNGEKIHQIFTELSEDVSSLSAPFMESYGLSALIKQSKPLLNNLAKFHELRGQLKETYLKKRKLLPENFKPKMCRQISADQEIESDVTKSPFPQDISVEKSPEVDDMLNKTPASVKTSNSSSTLASAPAPAPIIAKIGRKNRSVGTSKLSGKDNVLLPPSSSSSKSGKTHNTSKIPIPWIKAPPLEEMPFNGDNNRILALDFLQQAAAFLPHDKVNRIGLAQELENAIFKFFSSDNAKYWDKVHALSAAICGKCKTGTIVPLIVQGHFLTADKLVLLREDILHKSYEGQALSKAQVG